MEATASEREKLQLKLNAMEAELEELYYMLGKRTQEFVENQSETINALVDDIILTKKKLLATEENID